MAINYDIINSNLEKLNNAIKAFPDILGKYRETKDDVESAKLKSFANKVGLKLYTDFISWIDKFESVGQSIIFKYDIPFDYLKENLITNCYEQNVKDFIKKKNKKGFVTFLNSPYFDKYNGGRIHNRRRSRKGWSSTESYYAANFANSECILFNWIIQNGVSETKMYSYGNSFFVRKIPDFEYMLNTELEITNDITKSILKKIDSIKFDFRKINCHLLISDIERKIKEKILSVDNSEKIKCIESKLGITLNRIYSPMDYRIDSDGSLRVMISNDDGQNNWYNYRLFECVGKLRDNCINDILNSIEC